MRIKVVLAIWLLGITLAWMAVAPTDLGVWPLVDAQGPAFGWWQLRQHAIYLSGLWSISLMALAMLLALRLPLFDRVMGGMDQVYRLHKWTGIAAAVTAIGHWGAKESSGWIKDLWGRAGKPRHDTVLPWLTDTRGFAKDLGEWAFYLLLAMVALTLLSRLLPYKQWRVLHRAMPMLFLALVLHAVALMPLTFWALPLGLLMGTLLALGSLAALWSLAGWVGRSRSHAARIQSVAVLGDSPTGAPVEVICAMPKSWPGHRAGQFVFVRFDAAEGAHPFTIASAPHALGTNAEGQPLLRLVIKPLGDYTRTLHQRLHAGQRVSIEGPYGRFDGRGSRRRQQVWVAAGVGVTPFLALLEARGTAMDKHHKQPAPVHLHYCTRDALRDPLLARLQALCAQALPPVRLTVHNEAQGQRLTPQDLETDASPLDIWFCGPQGLGDALHEHARGPSRWRLHRESFVMRRRVLKEPPMKQHFSLRKGLLALALGLAALPTWADDDCDTPLDRWQSREQLRQMAAGKGWQIQRLKIDDGCYEIRGTDEQGRSFKAKIDPETLKVLKLKQRDRDRDHGREHAGPQSQPPLPDAAAPSPLLIPGTAPRGQAH